MNWRQAVLTAAITLAIYLAANPTPRDDARTFLNTRVIPGLRQVNPFLVGDRIWTETLNCRLVRMPTAVGTQFATHCENLLGQIIRLPGALVHTAGYVAATGWPGIAVGALTVIFMVLTISGNLGNPLMWPLALLLGSVIAGIVLWVLQWILILVAWGIAWILWAIALVAGWLLAGDWVLRGLEIRRAIGGGHGGPAPAAEAIRPKGGPAGR
ncbi:MAG TPA: hypothetical protein VGX97_00330 [bacterium]|nr:hypothetical protein [bacterium]